MSDIDSLFRKLRVGLRQNGIAIAQNVFTRVHPATEYPGPEICIFCKSTSRITREHVFPKWLFEKDTQSTFISSVNRQPQTFNKTVVPVCAHCNNTLLAKIEKHIIAVVGKMHERALEGNEALYDLIRWLEIIDYKAQVYDCRRKYLRHKDSPYELFFGSLPLAMMRHFPEMNPFKSRELVRIAQRRIAVKSKANRLSSLAVFQTARPHFYFFTQPDEYIYISFPMYPLSVFYFLREVFDNGQEAMDKAMYYIEGVRAS